MTLRELSATSRNRGYWHRRVCRSLGSQAMRDAGVGSPLTMQWEIKAATRQYGKLLAWEQAAAIREVPAWGSP
jgi:hypothetical protein